MNFALKGITKGKTIHSMDHIVQFGFDLRPRSFNFTQLSNIKEIIRGNPQVKTFVLIFENESTSIIKELYAKVEIDLHQSQELWVEFSGSEKLEDCEQLGIPYVWHFKEGYNIKVMKEQKLLKRVAFTHSLLEQYNDRGELHGFFNLFQDLTNEIFFEVQLDWDSEIILSFFDYFPISMISFEINHKVELSYQCPDHILMNSNLKNVADLFI